MPKNLSFILSAGLIAVMSAPSAGAAEIVNLIPDKPGPTPNYYMTFGAQAMVAYAKFGAYQGNRGNDYQELTEKNLFGPEGWATMKYGKVQGDVIFLLDEGWDYPVTNRSPGSLELDPGRFPSFTGTPTERLTKLNDKLKSLGWRGLGLWVCPTITGEDNWKKKMESFHQADIKYLKVDWGGSRGDNLIRIAEAAQKHAPNVVMEFAALLAPFNPGGRANDKCEWFLGFSQVFRTYDVFGLLQTAPTLDRIALLLAPRNPKRNTILNCEFDISVAAGLACAVGLPQTPGLKDPALNVFGVEVAPFDEIVRLLRWQRIMPALGLKDVPAVVDTNILWDSYAFKPNQTWNPGVNGKTIKQGAPARISRGLPLAEVTCEGEPPFVLASRHPNGAIAIATTRRTLASEKEKIFPLADVTLKPGKLPKAIGVFGRYRSLTFVFDEPIGQRRLWAQDLAGERAEDITGEVVIDGNQLTIKGQLIARVGLASATPGDKSDPGLALVFSEMNKKL